MRVSILNRSYGRATLVRPNGEAIVVPPHNSVEIDGVSREEFEVLRASSGDKGVRIRQVQDRRTGPVYETKELSYEG